MSGRPNIDALFSYSRLAVVGASPRNFLSVSTLEGLRSIGFAGQVACVNPNAEIVAGFPAYKTLADVPFALEHVLISIRADRVPDVMRECAALGVTGVTIHSDGFAEAGPVGRALQAEVAEISHAHDIAVCGPNCMGALSLHDRTSTYGRSDLPQRPGGVSVVSASGGMLNELLAYGAYRGIRFSKAISTGNEAVCEVADFLEHLLDDPLTSTIGIVLEGIRSVPRLRAVFGRALERRIPIVAIKLGTSQLGARAAATHTGSIVDAADLFGTLCAQYGIMLANDIDAMCESLLLFSNAAHVIRSNCEPRGVAVIEISGGGGELVCDIAERSALTLTPLREETASRLASVLPGRPSNPIDLTLSWEHPQSLIKHQAVLQALAEDGGFDVVISRISVPPTGKLREILIDHGNLLAEASREHPDMVFAALSRTSDPINPRWHELILDAGVIYLQGYERGLEAVANLKTYARFLALPTTDLHAPLAAQLGESTGLLDEVASKEALAGIGLPVNATTFVESVQEALIAAERLGFPIAIKGISAAANHKSDFGLVELGLRTSVDVETSASRILQALHALRDDSRQRTGLSVQASVAPGLEVIAGAYRDDMYGPIIVCGMGGFFAEAFSGSVLLLGPIDRASAQRAIDNSKVGELARGFRHLPPIDTSGLADILAKLSTWIAHEPRVTEVDLNPIILGASGPTIVDARIVLA
jgi:acyl-CoA synthetase (NDP forming)